MEPAAGTTAGRGSNREERLAGGFVNSAVRATKIKDFFFSLALI